MHFSSNPAPILVVGASGQLGAALCRQLGERALPAARRQLQPDWLPLDLEQTASDPASLARLGIEPAAVICAAGATDVERCESDLAWATAANHTGPLALAQAFPAVPFVFLSTDYVFDGTSPDAPYSETDATNPLSVYGRTKLAGEHAILDAHPRALVIRTTTVYGPDPQGKNFLYTLRRLLSEGKPMRVPTDQLATPTYNEDLAAAILALLDTDATGLFHAAGPDFLSRYDFALQACALLGLPTATLSPVTTPELNQHAARPLLAGLRIDKLNATLSRALMRPPAEGIPAWAASLAPHL